VAERSNALALKASVPRGTGGSNPPASAVADQGERRSEDPDLARDLVDSLAQLFAVHAISVVADAAYDRDLSVAVTSGVGGTG
jgi:hypothetical protein